MQEIHHSDISARDPTVDLRVYTINGTALIERRYDELSEFLTNKEDYEYVNLESFFQIMCSKSMLILKSCILMCQ
jgi:hypothetical protein